MVCPQSAGINVQSPQSESTPRRLTLSTAPKQRVMKWAIEHWGNPPELGTLFKNGQLLCELRERCHLDLSANMEFSLKGGIERLLQIIRFFQTAQLF